MAQNHIKAKKVTVKAPKPAPAAVQARNHHYMVIIVLIVMVVIAYFYLKKHGGLKGWATTLGSPIQPTAIGSEITNAGKVGSNTLTQAEWVLKFPRVDGKSDKWDVTVPNITYIDRFGPGDQWQRNSDGKIFRRVGNRVQVHNDQAGHRYLSFTDLSISTGTDWQDYGGYLDKDWGFGTVMGDMDYAGQPTAQWDATPLAQAQGQMIQNIADAQQAYNDFSQYFAGKPDIYTAHLADNTANLTRIYGSNWPSWTKGGSIFTKPFTPATAAQKAAMIAQAVTTPANASPGVIAINGPNP